jgi:hypothetical protein
MVVGSAARAAQDHAPSTGSAGRGAGGFWGWVRFGSGGGWRVSTINSLR